MSSVDLVIRNSNIITMDGNLSRKNWIAIKDGIIHDVGNGGLNDVDTGSVIDGEGKTVLPGLIDCHVHSSMTGIGQRGIDLSGIDSVKGILDKVNEFCLKIPGDKVICGCNMNMPQTITEGRLPTRYELDEVTGDHPVMLVLWTAHGGCLNSKAIDHANLTEGMKSVEKEGFFNEDEISFHVIGNIYNLMTDKDFEEIYVNIAKECATKGITTIHSLDGMMVKDDRDTEVLKKIMDELIIEIVPYTQTFDYQKIQRYGLKQIGGCLSVDGSPPQLTGAYSNPYPMAPHTRGFLTYTDKELYDFVTAATKAGLQTAFHAIGDRAVDQIIYIYQQVDREIGIKDLRHRIEHFSTPTDQHIEMAAEMNIVASAQPVIGDMQDGESGNGFEAFAPPKIAAYHENFARVIRGGVTVCGGSDSPVTPMDCFKGLNSCVNAYNEKRRVSLDDALKMYTVNAAYAAHEENKKGSLEKGKQADMIIIDKDPYKEEGEIDRSVIKVEKTIKKGKIIFESS